VTAGHIDQKFRDSSSTDAQKVVGNPTGSKPESKLWFHAGSWWGVLWDKDAPGGEYRIYKLTDPNADNGWTDTGVAVDGRRTTRADALASGRKLYVASHVFADFGKGESLLYRYTFKSGKYHLDSGFPKQIGPSQSETLVITKESHSSTLWATWTQTSGDHRLVMVAKGRKNGTKWGNPFKLPRSGSVSTDDISSIVTFGRKIGVLWNDGNNGNSNTFRFAWHQNGTKATKWHQQRPGASGSWVEDDHINMKTYGGKIYAVVKTSSTSCTNQGPLVQLLVRSTNGNWNHYGVSCTKDPSNDPAFAGPSRPIMLIDTSTKQLHFFVNGPGQKAGQIWQKSSPITGLNSIKSQSWSLFIADNSNVGLVDPTSTKQNVNATTGIVVAASNQANTSYYHGFEPG
jgi:hypothetical protein